MRLGKLSAFKAVLDFRLFMLNAIFLFTHFYLAKGQNVTTVFPMTEAQYSNKPNLTCRLVLANNQSYLSLRQTFQSFATSLKLVVYFNIKTQNRTGGINPITATGPDSFASDVWVWATSKGKNLLRMPLDYNIMSLGLLTIDTYQIDVVLHSRSGECLSAVDYRYASHLLAQFIAENITENGTTVGLTKAGPVVCRRAFAFNHRIFGERGIGFKCCSPPLLPGDWYNCQTPYTVSWELVWYGPVVLMCWIYAIAFIHFYRIYRHAFVKRQIRQLSGVEQTILEIKQDIVTRIVQMSDLLGRIRDPDELISLRERVGFLDAFGVSRSSQYRVTYVSRIVFVTLILTSYYAIIWLLIEQYRIQLKDLLLELNDTSTAYLNVVGHFGWLFCRRNLAIYYIAILETTYTVILPFFVFVVYIFIVFKDAAKTFSIDPQKAQLSACKRSVLVFVSSKFGRVFHVVCLFLFLIYIVLIAGVFIAYVVYFSVLGVFANIEIVSPWIVPLIISINFFATALDPVYYQYNFYKEMFFSICLQAYKQLTIRRQKEVFMPRDLLDTFYIPKSRVTVYRCVLRILWIMAFVFLLLMVILTLQYPYDHQTDSIVSFLGVQVVFVLPLLAQFVYNNKRYSSLEETIIHRDVVLYIKNYLKTHPVVHSKSAQDGNQDEAVEGEEEIPEEGDVNQGFEGDGSVIGGGMSATNPIVIGGQKVLEMSGIRNPLK